MAWHFTDRQEHWRVELVNGALHAQPVLAGGARRTRVEPGTTCPELQPRAHDRHEEDRVERMLHDLVQTNAYGRP